LKIGTYNVEWFAGLFDSDNHLLLTDDWSSRRDVTKARQLEAIAQVIRAIDADCLLIVEAPDTGKTVSTKTALLNFSEGHSSVEVVLGTTNDPQMMLFDPHAIARLDPRDTWSPSTARFYQHHRKSYLNALLDFIMVSPKIAESQPIWKIWHPFDDQNCFKEPTMQQALLDASDHFPVTLEIGD